MNSYENDFISAARSGGSGTILLVALISIAQDPGSDDIRFSPRIFFVIVGLILILPIIAYRFIIKHNLGLKQKIEALPEAEMTSLSAVQHVSNPIMGKMLFESDSPTAENDNCMKKDIPVDRSTGYSPINEIATPLDAIGHTISKSLVAFVDKFLPFLPEQLPW
jgi:hypothetical protein